MSRDGRSGPGGARGHARARRRAWLTVPNVLSAVRLVGSFVLAGVAVAGREEVFLWLFLALIATDWIDGKLAIVLDQRTELGARLDSFADAALYAALLFGGWWMFADVFAAEAAWIASAVVSYAASSAYGLWKFSRWPSYHTRAAKTCWLLVTVGVAGVLAGWSPVPLRIAMAAVTATNIEAMLITYFSSQWRANISSLWVVLRRPR